MYRLIKKEKGEKKSWFLPYSDASHLIKHLEQMRCKLRQIIRLSNRNRWGVCVF